MQISTDQLWVVEHPKNNRYSLDTSMPDEVFTTLESAQAYCDELNSEPLKFTWASDRLWQVHTLSSRLCELRSNLRESGASNERETQAIMRGEYP
jgi:hypothetical protein